MTTLKELLTLNWHVSELDVRVRDINNILLRRIIISPDAKSYDWYTDKRMIKAIGYEETFILDFVNYGDNLHVDRRGNVDSGIGTIWKAIPKDLLDMEVTHFSVSPKDHYFIKDEDGEYVYKKRDCACIWLDMTVDVIGGMI